MADLTCTRRKNRSWRVASIGENPESLEHIQIAVLMDIRDELQSLVRLVNCYRIPRALDALAEMGAEARRKKRALAKRRAAARDRK